MAIAPSAGAATIPLSWMQMTPTPFGGTPPNGSSYNVPGVGLVQINYTVTPSFSTARLNQTPIFGGDSITSGPNTYTWGPVELFARSNLVAPPPPTLAWSITYTFPTTMAANSVYLGVVGLGRLDQTLPGAISTCQVSQNGTYLGQDFGVGGPWGPNQFSSGPGTFSLQNAVSGPTTAGPNWNSALALVQINDAINSLTVNFNQVSGDGVGLNIAVITPAPGAAAVLGLGGVALTRRRRTA
ncbi:MAG: hypothetical protein GC200_11515 [Tepidisphaera sp.]|nr:hypothetical protein [Tepidisphaera sp.]